MLDGETEAVRQPLPPRDRLRRFRPGRFRPALILLGLFLLGLLQLQSTPPVSGQTAEPSCTDSDGGLNYEMAGFVEGIGFAGWPYTRFDVCETGDREGYVREYYCNGASAWPSFYQCPGGCQDGACIPPVCTDVDGDGYAVEGGACGEVDCDDSNAALHPGAIEVCDNGVDDDCDGVVDVEDTNCDPICFDSDGGRTYDVAGYVRTLDNYGQDVVRYDVCDTGDREGYVREYYCNGTSAWPSFYQCPGGCQDGACQPAVCTDADGDGYAVEGGACGEVDCDDSDATIFPGAIEVCDNGVDDDCDGVVDVEDTGCDPICYDSDGGRTYDVAGYVRTLDNYGRDIVKYDVCDTGYGEGYVREYYCNNTAAWPSLYQCPYGCQDGACQPFTCTDADEDGYAAEGGECGDPDCDDAHPAVHPGASEVCDNGVDDDCNGLVDADDPACVACRDSDTGIKPYRQGTVSLLTGESYTEVCATDTELLEYACDASGQLQSELVPCANGCSEGACSAPNIILVGWDGVQRDHLHECYNRELPECAGGLPNLERLSGGAIWNNTTTSGGTCTKPGWAQIASGYSAEVMGIYDLDLYQPLPAGYSVFEKAEARFGADQIVSIFVSGKGVHTGGACIGDPTYDDGVPAIEDKGQPYCITKESLDYFELDQVQNYAIGTRALELVEAHQYDLFLAYFIFRDPDVTGHLAGESSVAYSEKILELDSWTGQIFDKLAALGIDDRTLIYVVTDHGFDEGTSRHINAPYGFLASNDTGILRSGDRQDVAPTILDRYGITLGLIGSAPAVNGESLLAPRPFACVPEGFAFIDYPGAPTCCADLTLIGLDKKVGGCVAATGATGDTSGYCTRCGDGMCLAPENLCSCPEDCQW